MTAAYSPASAPASLTPELETECNARFVSQRGGLIDSRCNLGVACFVRGSAASNAMKTLTSWAPVPNLNVTAVEQGNPEWIVSVQGRDADQGWDRASCPVCGTPSSSRHSAYILYTDAAGSFRTRDAGENPAAAGPLAMPEGWMRSSNFRRAASEACLPIRTPDGPVGRDRQAVWPQCGWATL